MTYPDESAAIDDPTHDCRDVAVDISNTPSASDQRSEPRWTPPEGAPAAVEEPWGGPQVDPAANIDDLDDVDDLDFAAELDAVGADVVTPAPTDETGVDTPSDIDPAVNETIGVEAIGVVPGLADDLGDDDTPVVGRPRDEIDELARHDQPGAMPDGTLTVDQMIVDVPLTATTTTAMTATLGNDVGDDDEVGDDDDDVTDDTPAPVEPRHERLPKVGVVATAIVVIVARFAFAYDRIIYQLAPDEPGSLAMARFLSGGVRFTMFDFNTWRPGLAVLLAPANAITSDPPTLMRAAFAINAVLAAIATIILARLAVRLTSLPTWACLFAAATISLTAQSLSASAHVWAESLVTVSTLWLITALIQFFDEPRLGPAISASTAVAVGVLSHGRLLPLLPTMAVVVGFTFIRARRYDRLAKWGVYTAAVSGATILFTNWVFAEVWDSPGGTNTVGTVLSRIVNIPAVARSAVGQLWYQMVVTFGVFGVGLAIVTWHAIVRRPRLPLVRDARVVLIVTLPLIVTSIAFMAERTRTDHRIYGRYNDAIVWPLLIVGIGWLASNVGWTRRLAMLVGVLATTVGAGALVDVLDGAAMADSIGVRPMIAGFLPMVGTASSLDPWLLTAAGAAGTVIVFWLLPRRHLTAFTVLTVIVLLTVGGYRTHTALATRLNSWAAAGAVVEIDEIIDPQAPLAFRMVRDKEDPAASWTEQRRRSLLYQVYLPGHRFERDRGPEDGGSPYVFAPLDDPVMTEADATLVWTDETVKIGLWVEPGAPYVAPEPAATTTRPRTG